MPNLTRKNSTPESRFVAHLDAAIKFHQRNSNDPHNVSNAVICALVEVRNAFAEANDLPCDPPKSPGAEAQGGDGHGDEPPPHEHDEH